MQYPSVLILLAICLLFIFIDWSLLLRSNISKESISMHHTPLFMKIFYDDKKLFWSFRKYLLFTVLCGGGVLCGHWAVTEWGLVTVLCRPLLTNTGSGWSQVSTPSPEHQQFAVAYIQTWDVEDLNDITSLELFINRLPLSPFHFNTNSMCTFCHCINIILIAGPIPTDADKIMFRYMVLPGFYPPLLRHMTS